MKFRSDRLKALRAIGLAALLATSISACAAGGSAKWQEEVLLHDGRKIVVERSQIRGGYVTIDSRTRTILEEEWIFPVPGTGQKLSWKNDIRNPPQGQSLILMLVGFVNEVAYLATSPAGCIAYNYWGRPNPPYVFFRHDGKAWQRIPLVEFPLELSKANVVVGGRDNQERQDGARLSIREIEEGNNRLELYHRVLAREPIKVPQTTCEQLVYYKGAWIGPGDSIGKRMMDRQSKHPNSDKKTNFMNEGGR